MATTWNSTYCGSAPPEIRFSGPALLSTPTRQSPNSLRLAGLATIKPTNPTTLARSAARNDQSMFGNTAIMFTGSITRHLRDVTFKFATRLPTIAYTPLSSRYFPDPQEVQRSYQRRGDA